MEANWLDNQVRDLLWANSVRADMTLVDIPAQVVHDAVRTLLPALTLHTLDAAVYRGCVKTDFNRILGDPWHRRRNYILDLNDCDDFTIDFKGLAHHWFDLTTVGIVIDDSSAHAYNIVYWPDGTASLFEPQTDSWPSPGQGLYLASQGLVLI